MGLSGHQIAVFPYAVQRLSTTRKLQLTAVRSRGVAVGVGGIVAVDVDVGALRELANFD